MIGETLADRYLVKERLAAGRFLSTYKGWDTALGTAVSVDVLDGGAVPCGLGESRMEEILDAALLVRGRNIACLYHWGRVGDDGAFYMVGEKVDGASLLDVLDECGALPPQQVMEIVRTAVEALAEAYGRGLFYLGLNPGQFVIDARAAIKLIRVGYGWILEEGEPSLSRRVSPYRAPETDGGVEGKRTSDVFALATMIRGMLPRDAASERLLGLLDTATDPMPRNRPSSPRLVLEELEKSVAEAASPKVGVEVGDSLGREGGLSFIKDGTVRVSPLPAAGKRRGNMLRRILLILMGGLALWVGFAALAGLHSDGKGREEAYTGEEGEKKVTLPDLQGLTVDEACEILKSMGLEHEARRAPSRLWSAGRVAAQEPGEGSVLRRGEKVLLVVSAGRDGVEAGGSDADGTGGETTSARQADPSVAASPGDTPSGSRLDMPGAPPSTAVSTPRGARKQDAAAKGPSTPRAVPSLSTCSGPAPLYVSMDGGRSYDPDGDIVRYLWYCGDGTVLEGIAAQHVFDPAVIPARFQIVLEVLDSQGLRSSSSVLLEVY